jgi:hypothetical protein
MQDLGASLDWGIQGPQGIQGSTGPASPAAPAVSYEVEREEVDLNRAVDARTTGSAQCSSGTLISGGWETDPLRRVDLGKAHIDREGTTLTPVSYAVTICNSAGGDGILRLHVVCAIPQS